MSTRTRWFIMFLFPLFGIMPLGSHTAYATSDVTLYTPYTKIVVPPGESVDYAVDVINNSSTVQHVDISVSGVPKGWNYTLKSGGWNIKQLSILPGEKKSFSLKVDVPLKVNKGDYRFRVLAGGLSTLPLIIAVSEQGTFKTEFTTNQANMEGHSNSTFTFNADLKNLTGDKQLYALKANALPGWEISFKANYKQTTSVEIEAGNNVSITVEMNPPDNLEAGIYKIPVMAQTSSTSARLDLEVVITGSYSMELTTPRGLLSTSITAGNDKRVELLVKNTGSSVLNDIELDFTAPINWDVTFDPKKVDILMPGTDAKVFATIHADRKAIAGDYITEMEAKTREVSSKASFRISVKTPMILGWLGVLIILAAVGSVYYLFRKFGRR